MPKKPKLRVFLDSNVIFSGLYSAEGPAGIILDRFIDGELVVVISQQVLREVVATIKEKLPAALPVLRAFLGSISLEIIKDPTAGEVATWTQIIHQEDAAILAAAVTAQPDYLITGDKHFLRNLNKITEKSGLRIVTPGQFLAYLSED